MSTCNKIACKESLCHAVKGRCAWDGVTTRKSESLQGSSEFLNYDTSDLIMITQNTTFFTRLSLVVE